MDDLDRLNRVLEQNDFDVAVVTEAPHIVQYYAYRLEIDVKANQRVTITISVRDHSPRYLNHRELVAMNKDGTEQKSAINDGRAQFQLNRGIYRFRIQ